MTVYAIAPINQEIVVEYDETMERANDVAGASVEMENKILSLRDAAEMFVKSMRAM